MKLRIRTHIHMCVYGCTCVHTRAHVCVEGGGGDGMCVWGGDPKMNMD